MPAVLPPAAALRIDPSALPTPMCPRPRTRTAAVEDPETVWTFSAIGTGWRILTPEPVPTALRSRIAELIDDFDRTWSRFRSDSLISRVAHRTEGSSLTVPARDIALLDLYDRLVAATDGAIDPLVGRDLDLLGYDPLYRLQPDTAGLLDRRISRWSRDVHRRGTTLHLDHPTVIDVGAAGKGWLVDLVADVLTGAGVHEFLIDAGGDLRHRGLTAAIIGLEHPDRPGRVIGTLQLQNASLCASTIRRRAWGDGLHHVLHGHDRHPQTTVVASWVLASDTATADGIATALMVTDPRRLDGFSAAWLRILADGRLQWTDRFPADLTI